MPITNQASILAEIANQLTQGNTAAAASIASDQYPFTSAVLDKRSMSQSRALEVFLRDGFIDRYFGMRLVFPGALLLIGQLMPENFPMHPTWTMAESHHMYWELWPAVDHCYPLSRGGLNNLENLYTTSTRHNTAKAQWTLEEIGWELHPTGDLDEWDGLLSWCMDYIATNPDFQPSKKLESWHKTARKLVPKWRPKDNKSGVQNSCL